jgi:hypothetical protein
MIAREDVLIGICSRELLGIEFNVASQLLFNSGASNCYQRANFGLGADSDV